MKYSPSIEWVRRSCWLLLAMVVPSVAAAPTGGIEALGPLAGLHAWELDVIPRFQYLGDFGWWMEAISQAGPGKVALILVAVLFLAVDARLATRTMLVLMLSLWVREVLALTLQSPRPYWIDPAIRTFHDPPIGAPTFGLPSGHAVGATALWFFLAAELRRRWAWIGAATIIVAVAVSRVYLGLHFISDVVAGIGVGALCLVALRWGEGLAYRRWCAWGRGGRVAAVLVFVALLVAIPVLVRWGVSTQPAPAEWGTYGETARRIGGAISTAGAVCGVLLALALNGLRYNAGGPWRLRVWRLAIAALPVAFYYWRPASLRLGTWLPQEPEGFVLAMQFAKLVVAGMAAWWLAPSFFVRRKLARTDAADRRSVP